MELIKTGTKIQQQRPLRDEIKYNGANRPRVLTLALQLSTDIPMVLIKRGKMIYSNSHREMK